MNTTVEGATIASCKYTRYPSEVRLVIRALIEIDAGLDRVEFGLLFADLAVDFLPDFLLQQATRASTRMAQFVSKVVVVVVVAILILASYLGQPLSANLRIVTTEGDNSTSTSSNRQESPPVERVVEVKVGFLVGSRRLAGGQQQLNHDHHWPRPGGRQLKYAFNYAIGKFNQFNSDIYYPSLAPSSSAANDSKQLDYTTNNVDQLMPDDGDGDNSSGSAGRRQTVGLPGRLVENNNNNNTRSAMLIKIKFQPIIKETYGSQSESIKQTIELITKHDVNFILGPQETCQIEPKLASVFNVAMLSHYCTTWSKASDDIGIGTGDAHRDNHHDQRIKLQQQSSDVVDVDSSSIGSSTSPVPLSPMKIGLLPSSSSSPLPISPKQTQQQQQQHRPQRHSSTTNTFIQIKPPHWKIVSRVVALVEQLLAVSYATASSSSSSNNNNTDNNSLYPQQLVLLYFKPPPPTKPPSLSERSRPTSNHRQPHESSATDKSSHDSLSHLSATDEANDAIQYRLIGELLEIKLNELIATTSRRNKKQRHKHPQQPSLSALNWHTTFHYGYTKNPFRSVLRRHLFPPPASAQPITTTSTNQSSAYCSRPHNEDDSDSRYRSSSVTGQSQQQQQQQRRQFTPKSRVPPEAIYIVVGHYYEHLGLMLALNELNLLPATTVSSSSTASAAAAATNNNEQQSTQEPIQSSVGKATAATATADASAAAAAAASMMMMMRRPSVVIGVDTEPYDERDDSVRFLRGLLMDSAGDSSSPMQSAEGDLDLESISNLYRAYLGVVPAKPTHSAEFLDEMRSLYANESLSTPVATTQSVDSFHPESLPTLTAAATNNQTQQQQQQQQQQQLQLSARLLQFIRLPVEAFYLYDAVMLLGFYLKDCLLKWGPNGLQKCSQGNRTFEWFRQRDYVSHVTHNWSRFDYWAQAEGSYSLITRRGSTLSSQDDESNSSATLIPVGYFTQGGQQLFDSVPALTNERIGVHLSDSWDEVDPIWLPFWCHVRKNFNSSNACQHLFQALIQDANNRAQMEDVDYEQQLNFGSSYPFGTIVIVVSITMLIALYLVYGCCWRNAQQKGSSRSKDFNTGWFSELDERNFLELIYKYLLAPEANESLAVVDLIGDDNGSGQHEQTILAPSKRVAMLDLHCNMFAFPSCSFVHWLTAMYQLKEMLLKFKCNNSGDDLKQVATRANKQNHNSSSLLGALKVSIDESVAMIRSLSSSSMSTSLPTDRQFFSIKHPGTNSLRLLLNKYKSVNQCLINLTRLDHCNVASLRGITMSCNVAAATAAAVANRSSRTVHMILEQSDRRDLRQAFSAIFWQRHSRPKGAHLCWMNFKDALIDSLICDILGGLEFLHKSSIGFHGDLRATTCLISYDWRLKLSGFHANHLRRSLGDYEQKIPPGMETAAYFDQLVYSAPELIKSHSKRFSIEAEAMRLADIYSFAFVAYELFSDGLEPWSSCTPVRDSRLIVDRVKEDTNFRPSLSKLDLIEHHIFDSECMQKTIRSCWSHSPERRPQSIALLKARICNGKKQTFSTGGELMRVYTKLIERSCINQRKYIDVLNGRMTDLKNRFLPGSIVSKLCQKQPVVRQHFDCVSFGMFRVVFGAEASGSIGEDPIEQLGRFMLEVTQILNQYQNHLHILDSQADSLLRFLVFSGEPLTEENRAGRESARGAPMIHHAQLVASFALQIVDLAARLQTGGVPVQVRCGLHCGTVFGGLLSSSDIGSSNTVGKEVSYLHCERGVNLARYILIGPTIQVANMLELTSQSQRIQISAEFRTRLLFTEGLSSSMSLSSTAVSAMESYQLDRRQGYVIIKREAKIQQSKVFSTSSSSTVGATATHFEAYWLLNGPRLTASQSLMLLTRSCDIPTAAPTTNQADYCWKLCASDESDDNDNDYDDDDDGKDDKDDWHSHNHHWTHLLKPQK